MDNFDKAEIDKLFGACEHRIFSRKMITELIEAARMYAIIQTCYNVNKHWIDELSLDDNLDIVTIQAYRRLKELRPSFEQFGLLDVISERNQKS